MTRKRIYIFFVFAVLFDVAMANNIQVSSVSHASTNTAAGYEMISCNISWENSWRTSTTDPYNWDAAWVFVKYRLAGGEWKHATLNSSSSNHTAPSGSTISAGRDGKGVFVYRSADGTGTFTANGIELRWEYTADGLTAGSSSVAELCVYAIEMVYIPEGSFYAGDGAATAYYTFRQTGSNTPFNVTSSGSAIMINGTNTYDDAQIESKGLFLDGDGGLSKTSATQHYMNGLFPNGYRAFYCMKYEITQQQYVDFLNTLNYDQQLARTLIAPSNSPGSPALSSNSNRNGIDIKVSGVPSSTPAVYACNLDGDANYDEPEDGQSIACNKIGWSDLAAYFDWTGLRPMTELEFEKACRGSLTPVINEYAWGSTNMTVFPGEPVLANSGAETEVANSSSVNCNYDWTLTSSENGPTRVGAFASAGTTRVQSGASYYGVMELSGNVWEKPVTIGIVEGRSYTGLHGNGTVDANGNADVPNWPSNSTAVGIGFRGGTNSGNSSYGGSISSRYYAASANPTRGIQAHGGRGVRTADNSAIPDAPVTTNSTTGTASWTAPSGSITYFIDIATDVGFTNILGGYNNYDVGNYTSYYVSDILCSGTYYYRVRAANAWGSSTNSNASTIDVKPGCFTFGGSGTEICRSVIEKSGGGFLAVGNSTTTSTSPSFTKSILLLDEDCSNNISTKSIYVGTTTMDAYSVIKTNDGGYAVGGNNNSDFYIMKLDASLNSSWTKTISSGTDQVNSLIQTSDGGFAACGKFTSDYGVVKLDNTGAITMSKRFYNGSYTENAQTIVQLSSTNLLIAGTSSNTANAAVLMEMQINGTIVSSKQISGNSPVFSIIKTGDGGYLLAGNSLTYRTGSSFTDAYIIKLNSDYTFNWHRNFGGTNVSTTGSDYATCVIQTSDGGYAVAGYTNSFGAGGYDMFLAKCDANGTKQWFKTMGGTLDDYAYTVIEVSGGGYLVGGYSKSFTAGNEDFFLVKLDASGNSCIAIDNTSSVTWTTPGTNPTISNITISSADVSTSSSGGTVSSPAPANIQTKVCDP